MPYVGQKPADIISTAVDTVTGKFSGEVDAASLDISGNIDVDGTTNLDVVDIDGAVDMASTLAVGGVVTANAGVVVDNITIDGTEIDLSSGDLTIDVAGDIILDADGSQVIFADGGTNMGEITNDGSSNFVIRPLVQDKDIIFKGNDGGSGITALTLDMSTGGQLLASPLGVSVPSYSFAGDTDTGMTRPTGNTLQFVTGGSESMRIDSSGRVLMGSTSTVFDTDQVLHVSGTQGCNMRATVESVGGSVLNLQRSDTTEGDFLRLINSSNAETGQIKVNSSGTTVFENVSDYRLKDNIKDWTVDAIAKVKQIKIRTFDWKDQTAQTNGKDVIGVIAHELQEVYSYCVSGEKDGYGEDVDKDGNKKPMYQGVDYGKLTPLLTKALQEQQATIEALTARIVTLENA